MPLVPGDFLKSILKVNHLDWSLYFYQEFGDIFVENGELGYFSLHELKTVRGKLGLPVERDLWFKPTKLSDIKRMYREN